MGTALAEAANPASSAPAIALLDHAANLSFMTCFLS
jgi:hypothetical protein